MSLKKELIKGACSLIFFNKKLKDRVRVNLLNKTLSKSKIINPNKIAILEIPTIQDCRKYLIKHLDGYDYEIFNLSDDKACRKALDTCGIIISEGSVAKRYSNQTTIEVWHAAAKMKQENRAMALDYVIAPSKQMVPVYSKIFGSKTEKTLPLGSIKTDCFFDNKFCSTQKNEFYKKHPELKNKKIYVWAPTFRGKWDQTPNLFVNMDMHKIDKCLEDNEVLLIKLHPSIIKLNKDYTKHTNLLSTNKKVLNVNDYDLNQLILVSDCFIADYSSSVMNAFVANKNCLFFCEDIDNYIKDRGLNLDLRKEAPFLIEQCSEQEFVDAIRNTKNNSQKYNEFKEKWVGACSGKAGEKIKQLIDKELTNEK